MVLLGVSGQGHYVTGYKSRKKTVHVKKIYKEKERNLNGVALLEF